MSHDQEMGTETIPTSTTTSPPSDDPFFYGWRMVPRWAEDGSNYWEQVPLTAWDVLHPEEDDFIVQTDGHDRDCHYLKDAFTDIVGGRTGVKVFHDMRIDWQIPGPDPSIFGPDIVVFENLNGPWPVDRGTFPVKNMGANSALVVEVISPNTRETDTVVKVNEYHRVGVPLYVIVDRKEISGQSVVTVYGYQAMPEGYVRIPENPNGVWVEALRMWIRSAGDRVACVDSHGNRIPERPELIQQRDSLLTRADVAEKERNEEKQRAEQEKQRAEQEKQRAESAELHAEREKQRADETAQKLAELEAEIRRLHGDTN